MTDILLVQPPIRDFYLTSKRTIPYGLANIAATLLKEGFSVRILDCLATAKSRTISLPQEMVYLKEYYDRPDISPFALFHQYKHFGHSYQDIERLAGQSQAWLVGISSLFSAYSSEAVETAKSIRRALPHCKIVLGGHHPTENPEAVMRHEAIDYCIRGEGEQALVELAGALRTGGKIESVSGIVFREPDGTIRTNSPILVEKLDSIPLPAFDLIEHGFYQRKSRGSAVVCASRGCPLRCSYCSLGATSYSHYRRRSVESVLQEIDLAVTEYNAGFIDFEDENISMEKTWFVELLKGIQERFGRQNLELRAMNGLFPPTLDDEVIEAMAAAGFKTLNLSLGTTSPHQLKRFLRPDVTEAFNRALSSVEKYDLHAVAYIIVGAPEQDPYESLQDLMFLAEKRVLAGVSVFYPSPGSRDFKKCERKGILPSSFDLMRATALPISSTTTRDDSITLLRLGRLLNFMKSLVDEGREVLEPSHIEAVSQLELHDKRKIGKILLQSFLQDGILRGVTPGGELFEHKVNKVLCRKFLDCLARVKLRGTRI